MGVSLNPADFGKGGFLGEAMTRGVIASAKWHVLSYQKKDEPVTAATLSATALEIRVQDDVGGSCTENWSAGNGFTPTNDGKTIMPAREGAKINESSKVAMLLKSLVGAGLSMDDVRASSNDIGTLVGLDVEWGKQAFKVRGADQSVTVAVKVHGRKTVKSASNGPAQMSGLGFGSGSGSGSGSSSSSPASKAPNMAGKDADSVLASLIHHVGPVARNQIGRQVLLTGILDGDPEKQAKIKLMSGDDMLAMGNGSLWNWDGAVVSPFVEAA